jgi:hypothetical protein
MGAPAGAEKTTGPRRTGMQLLIAGQAIITYVPRLSFPVLSTFIVDEMALTAGQQARLLGRCAAPPPPSKPQAKPQH